MKIFGIQIGGPKLVTTNAIESIDLAKGTTMPAMTEVQGFGVKLGGNDHNKDIELIHKIARFNPWIASSIRAITRNSIQPVLKVWDPKSKKDVERDDLLALLRQPHPDFSEARFRKYLTFYYSFYGISFIYKVRMTSGKVIALQPLPVELVQLNQRKLAEGIVQWEFRNGTQLTPLDEKDLIVWYDDEFIDNYYKGGSKLSHLLFATINKNNADRFNRATIENGGEVKGVLYSEQRLTKDDISAYHEELNKRHGGPDKAGKKLILGNGLRYEQTGQTIQEMGFDKLQQVSREEVLAVFKVPPVELGLTDSVNYANAKEQRKLFWETTVIPTMDSLAAALTHGLLQAELGTTYEYYFDYSSIQALQTDLNLKLQSAQMMQFLGYPNTAITEYLDLPDLEDAPDLYTPATTDPSNDPAQKAIIIPAKFKSVYRESMKDLFGKSHAYVEVQFKRAMEKYFIDWRNDVYEFIKNQFGIKDQRNPQDELLNFIDRRTTLADRDLKNLGSVMFSKVNEEIVKKLIAKYGLKWYELTQSIITTNKHMENFVLINKTVDEHLREKIRAAYLQGIQNNYSSGEMADAFIDATRGVYKLAEKRATLIARTETTSMANDLMLDQYGENGVEAREWLTAQDGDVRRISDGSQFDHAFMDGKVAKVGSMFYVPNAYGGNEAVRYPGDMSNGSAGNSCNCRCTTIPV